MHELCNKLPCFAGAGEHPLETFVFKRGFPNFPPLISTLNLQISLKIMIIQRQISKAERRVSTVLFKQGFPYYSPHIFALFFQISLKTMIIQRRISEENAHLLEHSSSNKDFRTILLLYPLFSFKSH